MTHTSTEQPEALRLAGELEQFAYNLAQQSARELRRLYARLQELEAQTAHMADLVELADYATKKLEASQARVPLSADEIKEPKNGEAWRVEWWNESLRMMLPSDKVLHRFSAYRNGTIQFTLKARAHGITQEKQG